MLSSGLSHLAYKNPRVEDIRGKKIMGDCEWQGKSMILLINTQRGKSTYLSGDKDETAVGQIKTKADILSTRLIIKKTLGQWCFLDKVLFIKRYTLVAIFDASEMLLISHLKLFLIHCESGYIIVYGEDFPLIGDPCTTFHTILIHFTIYSWFECFFKSSSFQLL